MSHGDWKDMFQAVQNNDLELVRYHIKSGIDINYQHPEFMTSALIESIRLGQVPIAELLLKHGAQPDLKEVYSGETPVQVAHKTKNQEIIRLLEQYASPAQMTSWPDIPESATDSMKAAVYQKYGPPEVLHLTTVKKPIPKDHDLLIRNYATSVNSADWKLRKAEPPAIRLVFGLRKPRTGKQILGGVFAGVVEETGAKVSGFKKDDRVFGMTGMAMGTYAEYVCVHEKSPVATMPENINFDEAAAIPFGATAALSFLRKANLRPGQSIMIYGASGAVGSAAIQIAKAYGAHVTAVCSHANADLVLSLGADAHLNYAGHDFAKVKNQFDIVFETVNKLSFADCRTYCKPNGTIVLVAAGFKDIFRSIFFNLTGKQKIICGIAIEKQSEILFLKNMIAEGTFQPVIDRIYSLEDIIEAHTYVESGHKKGNVIIEI